MRAEQADSRSLNFLSHSVEIAYSEVADLSLNEIDRASPGLVAVGLRCTNINWQVCTTRKYHRVIKGEAPAPISFRQPIDADPTTEPTAIENDGIVDKRGDIHLARNDVSFNFKSAATRIVEPEIYACKIAGSHRGP